MKYVLVSYHPYEKSFNTAIVNKILKESEKIENCQIEHINLAGSDFNPVMTAKELYEFSQARTGRGVKVENLDQQAVEYAKKINACDHLIMIFPIWWELMPAMVKGFIDKVVFPGLFYSYKTEFTMKAVSDSLKKVSIITTMNTPNFLYSLKFKNTLNFALMKGTFKKLGIKKVKWYNFGFIKKVSNTKRENIINTLPNKLFS